ncbi:MAG: TM2 domain-containing protein [Thermacetogeniaceae bacterium]
MSLEVKQNLTDKQLAILNSEMEKHKRSVGLAYALYIFFGSIGVHKFYIGNIRWGVVYLLLGVLGWITIFTGGIAILAEDAGAAAGLGLFGTICLFVLGILLLIDLFTIPRQIRKHYEKAEQEIINKLTANV